MTDDLAPYTGFGDPDDRPNFAPFHVRVSDDEGMYGDWVPEANRTVRQIAGANAFDVYHGGFGPSRLTLTVWFDSRRDYLRLRQMYLSSRPGTLSLLAGFTSHEGPIRAWFGRDYEQYRQTLIDTLSSPRFGVGGEIEAEVTFLRAEVTP